MNAIDELRAEHEGIKVSLEILDRISKRLDGSSNGEVRDLESLVEFFRVFVDSCHHGKEEGLLFPVLEAEGVSREGGPIGVMLREHDLGRSHVRELANAIRQDPVQNPKAAKAIREHSEEYIRLLLAHIEKENGVLFKIADEYLSPEIKDGLGEGFERIETERVGVGRHEAFHRMLEDLQKKYLN